MCYFHLSQFLLRGTKKKTLEQTFRLSSKLPIPVDIEGCFAIGLPFYLVLSLDSFLYSLPLFWLSCILHKAHNTVLINRMFIHKVPKVMPLQVFLTAPAVKTEKRDTSKPGGFSQVKNLWSSTTPIEVSGHCCVTASATQTK